MVFLSVLRFLTASTTRGTSLAIWTNTQNCFDSLRYSPTFYRVLSRNLYPLPRMSRSISASQISNPINRLQTAYVLDEVAESMTINSAFEPGDPECDQLDITFTTIERILQELESEDVQPVDEEALISDTVLFTSLNPNARL